MAIVSCLDVSCFFVVTIHGSVFGIVQFFCSATVFLFGWFFLLVSCVWSSFLFFAVVLVGLLARIYHMF